MMDLFLKIPLAIIFWMTVVFMAVSIFDILITFFKEDK